MSSKSPQHTEACRKRMEEAMGGTDIGADRLAQSEQRMMEAIAKNIEREVKEKTASAASAPALPAQPGQAQAMPVGDVDMDAAGNSAAASSSSTAPAASSSSTAPVQGPAPKADEDDEMGADEGSASKNIRLMAMNRDERAAIEREPIPTRLAGSLQ